MDEDLRMVRAVEYLGREAGARVAAAAELAGLSPEHFSRRFRRWVGISPKRYLQHLTVEALKACLDAGDDVLSAAVAQGLSGPARVHDAFVTLEAVTPGEYRRGGPEIDYGFHPGPLGEMLLARTARGLCFLGFTAHLGRDQALAELRRSWPRAALREEPAATAALAARLAAGIRPGDPRLPLHLQGSNLQVQVWRALLRIPAGAVTSYGELAAALGRPGAARALGSAIGANPVAWLIPCHRVLRRSGALGGYRWAEPLKLQLLRAEARALDDET